jgi:hypothetical protein
MTLAQATQHALPEVPLSWIDFAKILAPVLIALVAWLSARGAKKTADAADEKASTSQRNTATNARAIDGVIQAQNKSPGPNVPPIVTQSVRAIADDPSVAIATPENVSPVATAPTPEAVTRGFNMANPPPDVT